MGLQLKKYEPLPDLTVQGNNYQAGNIGIAPVVSPAQNISVPTFSGPGRYSWSTPPQLQPPLLGAPGGGGLNVGHFFGSGLIENALNAPESIANSVRSAQAGDINPLQATGQISSALLNSAGLAAPVGKGASLAFKGGRLLPKVIAGAKVGAGYGGLYGASSAVGAGASPKQVAESTLIGAGTGALGGVALPVAGAGIKAGAKAVQTYDAAQNQIGAVGKNVNKPNVPEVGMTKEGFDSIPGVPDTKPVVKSTKLTAEDLGNTKAGAMQAPAEVNTARNPYKADLPVVKPNDYGQVIANEQSASRPVSLAGTVWQQDMRNLIKSNPTEAKNFWRYFKDPGYADAPKSPQLQKALNSWRAVDDRIHGNSQALGGNTNYLQDHGLHPVEFNDEVTQQLINGANPDKFAGLHSVSRKHATIADLEAAAKEHGFSVGTDPLKEGTNYIAASANALRRRAIVKGLGEADGHIMNKSENLWLGGDHNIPLSKAGANAVRGLQKSNASDNAIIRGARTANVGAKSTLLSFGQFHPINISVLRATPTLALPKPTTAFYRNAEGKMKFDPTMSSHPVRAAKGLYKTFRPLLPGGKNFINNVKAKAVADGMDIKAAKIGAPYNAEFLDNEGSKIAGVGHNLLGRQMLGMHDEAVRAVVGDLEKRSISLDSPEARTAGKAINNMMGFINDEAQKIPPKVSRKLGDWLLARQFTHSKFSQLRTGATSGGVGGAYARANVAANVAATTAVIGTIGYLYHQNSDNIKDLFIRALVDPAAPTGQKDSKGNTVKFRTPGTDTSDIAKLLGFKAVRNSDGHLGISWNPENLPTGVEDYLRARLAPGGSSAVKVATNQNYAGKPLYDPNAKFGTKVEQGATTIGTGLLPIGGQGLPQVNAIKSHLPGNVQDVLNAQKPGGNPLVKSVGSSFGLTPTTDQTVGKGQQSSQYFDAVAQNARGLDKRSADAYDMWTGSKKNPVTGKYDVQPNANDARAKAAALLDNPKALNAIISLNQGLAKQGQSTDPLWGVSKDQITKYLQYQNMEPGGASKTDWYNKNQSWYAPLVDQRNQFFDSLPAGDPNKPKLDIQYPNPSPQVTDLENAYSKITDSTAKGQFLDAHPELIQQWNKLGDYTNQMRQALGYSPLKNYPEASPKLSSFMNTYNGASKAQRKAIRNADPTSYQNMIAYFDSVDLYNVGKQASVSQLQGEPDYTSKEAKAISSLAQDIYKSPQGTYSIAPAGWMQGLSNSSSGGSGGSYTKKHYVSPRSLRGQNPAIAYDKIRGKKVSLKGKGLSKGKVLASGGKGRPAVSIKKSLV